MRPMTEHRLPGGAKAWFVRTGSRHRCHAKPVSVEGHVLTAAYALWVSGIAWLVASRDPGPAELIAAAAVVASSTVLYVLTVLRMSASLPRAGSRK